MISKQKLVRITTVPISLEKLLSGQLAFMSQFYDVTAVSAEPENLAKFGASQNVGVFPLDMTRKITPLQDIKAVISLYRYLKKTKPFIVHSHTPKAGIVGMLAAKLAGVPHRLHTVAGLPLLEEVGTKRKILDRVEALTYACATKVYPNSHGLLKIIQQNKYCNPSKLKVLANGSSNGIDTDYFDPAHFSAVQTRIKRNSLDIYDDDVAFIFVGRLVKDKGLNELVAAFIKLLPQFSNIKLLLVGNFENELDPLDPVTMHLIKSNPNIIEAGYQNDVRDWFAMANVLVFPSYREGFPNVVMQAGAMGLPAIVSDINGCNEIIEAEKNGIIIPVKNEQAIFDAMKRIISETEFRNSLRENARPMIVSRYSQATVWQAILSEYKNLEKNV